MRKVLRVYVVRISRSVGPVRSGPKNIHTRILEIDPVILKLSRFPQVQSERERTLVTVEYPGGA